MIKNIILYIVILLSAFFFNIFYFDWFSWILFLFIVLTPVISLVVSLPMMIKTVKNRVIVSCEEKTTIGEDFKITITNINGSPVPCPLMKIIIKADNSFAHINKKIKIKLSGRLNTSLTYTDETLGKHCGYVKGEIKSIKIYDLLGIFFISLHNKDNIGGYVMPQLKKLRLTPEFNNMVIMGYKPKPGGGFSDYYEIREYREGDSVRNIHWKLSLKTDSLMVREPSEPVTKPYIVVPKLSDKAVNNNDILGRIYYVLSKFVENNVECYALVDNDLFLMKIETFKDIEKYIHTLYKILSTEENITAVKSAITYAVSEAGEEIYQ